MDFDLNKLAGLEASKSSRRTAFRPGLKPTARPAQRPTQKGTQTQDGAVATQEVFVASTQDVQATQTAMGTTSGPRVPGLLLGEPAHREGHLRVPVRIRATGKMVDSTSPAVLFFHIGPYKRGQRHPTRSVYLHHGEPKRV